MKYQRRNRENSLKTACVKKPEWESIRKWDGDANKKTERIEKYKRVIPQMPKDTYQRDDERRIE